MSNTLTPVSAAERGPFWRVYSLGVVAAVALGLMTAEPALPSTEASDHRTPLERYRPVLRYDSAERHFAQPVGPVGRRARGGTGERIYGHLAREDGQTWLQYWLFYAYNPQDRGLLRTGRHEGDWEFLQLRLGDDGRPDLATLAQHSWAEGCRWSELARQRVGGDEAPVVFIANGSHATYSQPGTHDRPFPDPNDEADGHGGRTRPPLEVIDDDRPAWVADRGRWGNSRAAVIPGEQSSPHGPRFQEDGRWQQPASYHHEQTIPCGAAPPRRTWQTVLTLALALLMVGGVGAVGVRRYAAGRH